MFGSRYGATPFANSISPKKTREGVFGALMLPTTVIATIFWAIGQWSEGYAAI